MSEFIETPSCSGEEVIFPSLPVSVSHWRGTGTPDIQRRERVGTAKSVDSANHLAELAEIV